MLLARSFSRYESSCVSVRMASWCVCVCVRARVYVQCLLARGVRRCMLLCVRDRACVRSDSQEQRGSAQQEAADGVHFFLRANGMATLDRPLQQSSSQAVSPKAAPALIAVRVVGLGGRGQASSRRCATYQRVSAGPEGPRSFDIFCARHSRRRKRESIALSSSSRLISHKVLAQQ